MTNATFITSPTAFIAERTQFIRLGSSSSAVTQGPCGVPQGSVLGPLLFVAYISSTSNIAVQFGVGHLQYADDTQMYVALSPSDINTSVSNLQNCLTAMHLWFSQKVL